MMKIIGSATFNESRKHENVNPVTIPTSKPNRLNPQQCNKEINKIPGEINQGRLHCRQRTYFKCESCLGNLGHYSAFCK